MPLTSRTSSKRTTANNLRHCSISAELKTAAIGALNTFEWLHSEMEDHDWRDECLVQYKSRTVAENQAKGLRNIHVQKYEGVERPADDVAYRDLLIEKSTWLHCSVGELLANEPDLHLLAHTIAKSAVGDSIPIEKRLPKLARALRTLFDGAQKIDAVAGYEADEVTLTVRTWGEEVLRRHKSMMEFLRLFDSRCSAAPPKAKSYDGPVHAVHIADLNTVIVDGVHLNLNRARKAALFSLTVLGTDAISIEDFARLYDDDLYRRPQKVVNHANIFSQAITGLRKSLPHIVVEKPEPRLRTVFALSLTCDVPNAELRPWLNERTLKE